MAIVTKKFAWLPIRVETWRNTTAIVWLQSYYHKTGGDYIVPFGVVILTKKSIFIENKNIWKRPITQDDEKAVRMITKHLGLE